MAKQIIRITESDIRGIIRECIRNYHGSLLTEDRESKNMKKARNVVRRFQPNADAMQIITAIRNDIPNSRINQCEYLPGVTRMYMNNEINNAETISKLNATLKLLGTAHANEYNNDLNGMNADELINRFSTAVQDNFNADVEAHRNTQFIENKNYTIYRIESSQQAAKFGAYTDWCITSTEPGDNYGEPDDYDDEYYEEEDTFDPDEHPEWTSGYDMYQNYTHGGIGLFYFCIRDDYKTVPKEKGEGCPLDDYGLSMIATSVDEDGKCNTITCRWNHENGGNDNIMTPMQLSKLIGRNYYEVFRPYTREELYAQGKVPFGDVEMLLQQGRQPKDIFKEIKPCKNGLYLVQLNDSWNYLNPKTKSLLSKQWFYSATDFSDGFAAVSLDYNKGNYMREDGTFLYDKWIDGAVKPFNNGYATYRTFGKDWGMYIINTKGEIVNKEKLQASDISIIGNFICTKDYRDRYRLLFTNGTPVFDMYFCRIYKPDEYGWIQVSTKTERPSDDEDYYRSEPSYDYQYGLVMPNGKLFGGKLWEDIFKHDNGILRLIDENSKVLLMTRNGELIGGTAFDMVDQFNKEYKTALVKLNGKFNYLDLASGRLLLKNWVENAKSVNKDGCLFIELSGKWHVIGPDLKPITNMYFDSIEPFPRMFGLDFPIVVEKNGKYTLLKRDGSLLGTWFDNFYEQYGHSLCSVGGQEYLIDRDTLKLKPYTKEQKRQDKELDDELRYEKSHYY